VGRIGFWYPEGWPGFELGWMLRRASWGRGYATEGARAALPVAFTELGQSQVLSLIHPDNIASIRVARRLGERPLGQAEVVSKTADLALSSMASRLLPACASAPTASTQRSGPRPLVISISWS